MYIRKTRDVYVIQVNYGYGWDDETTEDTFYEAKEQAKTYRENINRPVRIKKRREPINS